ncbi:MAG: hypothetical protein WCW61_01915 [Patescibacteria group bacterium]|jgi:hypothetical protein
MKINKILDILSKLFLAAFFVSLVFVALLLYNYIFRDNSNSLNALIYTYAPVTIFTFSVFVLLKSKKNVVDNNNNQPKKKRLGKKIISILAIIIFILYLLFLNRPNLEGAKVFFSNGRLFIYTSNESSCFDWCEPHRKLYVPFKVMNINPILFGGEYKQLETKYDTCVIQYDNKDDLRIVYRKGKYWYKLKLEDSSPGCRLNGYVYRSVLKDNSLDLTRVKESFSDYNCDDEQDIEGIYEKSKTIIEQDMFRRSDILVHKYPSKQDICKYRKWKDTGDAQNCLTIYNRILKENCG